MEIKELLKDGINIEEVHFTVEIFDFVCDTSACTFLKCCKGHGGFYACERCEIKGTSIKNPRNKKRVYANINIKNKETFFKNNIRKNITRWLLIVNISISSIDSNRLFL